MSGCFESFQLMWSKSASDGRIVQNLNFHENVVFEVVVKVRGSDRHSVPVKPPTHVPLPSSPSIPLGLPSLLRT